LHAKPGIAIRIVFGRAPSTGRLSVDFDSETVLRAKEVQHVAAGGMLFAELEAGWALAQLNPEQNLRQA
jgi:hypothetical protein